jgi:DNA-binding MarR family transcriptional regulator
MSSIRRSGAARDASDTRRRRRLTAAIRESLREVNTQVSVINHHVGGHLDLRDVDIDCLDILSRAGALSPSALAKLAGLHPATMTGVLDRLESGRWVVRERATDDRRGVVVRVRRERGGEIMRLYAGMNSSLERICASYDEAQLEVLADFLSRTAEAGRKAAAELAERTSAWK